MTFLAETRIAQVHVLRAAIAENKLKSYNDYMELCETFAPEKIGWSDTDKTTMGAACLAFKREMAGNVQDKQNYRTESFICVVDIRHKIADLELTKDKFLNSLTSDAYMDVDDGIEQMLDSSNNARGKACEMMAVFHMAITTYIGQIMVAKEDVLELWSKAARILQAHGFPAMEILLDTALRKDESSDTNGRKRAEQNGESDSWIKLDSTGEIIKVQAKSSTMSKERGSLRVHMSTAAPGTLLAGVVFVPQPVLFVLDYTTSAPKTKTFSAYATSAAKLRAKLEREYGAVALPYDDSVYADLLALVRADNNTDLDISKFYPAADGFESDNVKKETLEHVLASILGATITRRQSECDMHIGSTSIDSKGGNLGYKKGDNCFNVRATAIKFHKSDKFYTIKVLNSPVDGRPMAIISELCAVMHHDGLTVNAFATPYISTVGERQFTEGFYYQVNGPCNTPNTRAGQIVSLAAIIEKTWRNDSLLSQEAILTAVGITPELLASSKLEVVESRKRKRA